MISINEKNLKSEIETEVMLITAKRYLFSDQRKESQE